MLLVHHLAAMALLAVACGADEVAHRFYFPSMTLLLDTPDATLSSGHDRRVSSTSGDAPEGGTSASGAQSPGPSAQAEGSAGVSTAAPSVAPGVPKIREPSRCMFAIVGCCRAGSMRVNDQCFEQFQCHGPFWGESPCRTQSAVAAHNIVSKYYEAKEAEKRAQEEAAAAAAAAPAAQVPEEMERPEESEESSPFDPIGPLPSRVDAMNNGRGVGP